MAKGYIKNPVFILDGHDLSIYVKGVTPKRSKAKLPVTASGDGGETAIHGLEASSFSVDLYQDKDMSVLDRILTDIWEAETAVVCEIIPAGNTVSEPNPSLTANVKLFDYTPWGGDVGTVMMTSIELDVQGATSRAGT